MRLPAARWAELVAAQRQSGLTTRQFATQHHVNESTLSWWRNQLKPSVSPAFVEVRLPPAQPSASTSEPKPKPASPPLRLFLAAGSVQVEVAAGCDLAWLRQVVQALS